MSEPLTPAPGFQGAADESQMAPAAVPVAAVIEDTLTFPAVPAPVTWPTFGDMLAAKMLGFDSKPALAILPCGHCGTAFTVPDAGPPLRWFGSGPVDGPWTEWESARPLYQARWHAHAAGWGRDESDIWTCPGCRQARQDWRAAAKRALALDAAAAAREHRSILAHADSRFGDAMDARGGEFTCRWSYEEPAAPAWAERAA